MCYCPDQTSGLSPYLGYKLDFHEQYVAGWRLGKGNCGAVYTAIRRADGKKLAVKCISKDPEVGMGEGVPPEQARAQHLQLVRGEIEILKSLKGLPSVVSLEDVFEDETKIYLVTELFKGGPISQKRTRFSEKETVRYMRGVLQAVEACHSRGVIHRDIKPENFLRMSKDKRAEVKAIDFGIAARFTPGALPVADLGHPAGTIFYMAPEVCRAQWWPESDVWAAGVMAAWMLTDAFPFNDPQSPEDPDPARTFRIIKEDDLDQSGPEWASVSPLAADFVRHLLVKDPAHRPTAAQALKHPFLDQGLSSSNSSLSLSSSMSLSTSLTSPWPSLDPTNSDELPLPIPPPAVQQTSLLKRLRKFAGLGGGRTKGAAKSEA